MNKKVGPRQVLSALGVMLISFGVLGWQMKLYWERSQSAEAAQAAESQPIGPAIGTHWDEAPTEVRLGVAAVIRGQLEAFKHDDYAAATRYQCRALRRQFPSATQFRQVIQSAYPQFAHCKSVSFVFVNTDKDHHFANAGVRVIGKDGAQVGAVYQMIWEEGDWHVQGVANNRQFDVPATNSKTQKTKTNNSKAENPKKA